MVIWKVFLEEDEPVLPNSIVCIDENPDDITIVSRISEDRTYIISTQGESYDMDRITRVFVTVADTEKIIGDQVYADVHGYMVGPFLYKGSSRNSTTIGVLINPCSKNPMMLKKELIFKIRMHHYEIPENAIADLCSGKYKNNEKVMVTLIDDNSSKS